MTTNKFMFHKGTQSTNIAHVYLIRYPSLHTSLSYKKKPIFHVHFYTITTTSQFVPSSVAAVPVHHFQDRYAQYTNNPAREGLSDEKKEGISVTDWGRFLS